MPAAKGFAGAADPEVFLKQLARFVGTTVTIYTTSSGQSGFGLTGVLKCVEPGCIKLINCIGPAPCCAPGSACAGEAPGDGAAGGWIGYGGRGYDVGKRSCNCDGGYIVDKRDYIGSCGCFDTGDYNSRRSRGCSNINDIGSETVIPVDRIAAYVHNDV